MYYNNGLHTMISHTGIFCGSFAPRPVKIDFMFYIQKALTGLDRE